LAEDTPSVLATSKRTLDGGDLHHHRKVFIRKGPQLAHLGDPHHRLDEQVPVDDVPWGVRVLVDLVTQLDG
jgi:hypothetical protein